MTDVRELLARLNQTTVRFDVGQGGGVPALTNIDIAGALGMVSPGLGREVLEACWWPDGAALRRPRLRDAVIALVEPEVRQQRQRLDAARVELGIAQACIAWTASVTDQQRRELDRARGKLEFVAAQCWPRSMMESLPTLVGAVLAEIAGAGLCEACKGRGALVTGEAWSECAACKGRGVMPTSDRQRARAIGRDFAVYCRNWRAAYLWLLDRFLDAEQQAVREFADAVARDAA